MKQYFYLIALFAFLSGCTYTGQSSDTPLLETRWDLSQLFNEKILYSGSQIPYLRFDAERVNGNNGCNNFFGPYTLDDHRLEFGLLASTRMACPQIEGFEIFFDKMLSMTTHYRISGNRLDLYENETLLASFLASEQD